MGHVQAVYKYDLVFKSTHISTCDAIRQNESELAKNQYSSFNVHCMPQFQSYIKLKTFSKLGEWFEKYSHLCDVQNSKMQRKLNAIITLLAKSNISEFQLTLLDHITCISYF